MARFRSVQAVLTMVAMAACGGESAGVPGVVVRDSAGVRIVDNGEVPTGAWQLRVEPRFTVGWDENGPMLTWPQSGRILPDGGALIGESEAGTMYRIGPEGSVVEAWGRKGEGPGEYEVLDAILFEGDSILVSDGRLRRLTVLSPDGDVRTTRLAGTFRHQASAILTDGRLLLVPGDGYSGVDEIRPEWVFETSPILAVALGGGAVDTLAELPHLRRWYGTRGAPPGPVQVKGRAAGFSRGFAWARSDRREVRWYDGAGRLVQLSRWEEEPVPLSPEWRSRMLERSEEAYRRMNRGESFVAAQLTELEVLLDRHGGMLPYWDSFHVDRLGNVWLSAYTFPGEPLSEWRVFAEDGRVISWVDLPDIVTILDITDDRILAVRRDELDVPAVIMLDLIKP